ncbi:hypothetical protein CCHR01_09871 [Colletotrichum chrysophilum]|uniref:Uncharacterized protein n=1 Tax=Colletotrichum chrysophilum TaxID=1836956 RepID=A0AAD9EGA7_9PEZI|nr:hypothetical protein CCHR01_09871 [Colletotrichum chrysophilum]
MFSSPIHDVQWASAFLEARQSDLHSRPSRKLKAPGARESKGKQVKGLALHSVPTTTPSNKPPSHNLALLTGSHLTQTDVHTIGETCLVPEKPKVLTLRYDEAGSECARMPVKHAQSRWKEGEGNSQKPKLELLAEETTFLSRPVHYAFRPSSTIPPTNPAVYEVEVPSA